MSFHFNLGLWFAAQFLQAGILVALYVRGWLRRYPAFTAYILLLMVSDPLLALANGNWPYTYYFGYWTTVVATTALTLVVLFEVVDYVWRPSDAWRKLVVEVVCLVIALSIAQFVLSAHFSKDLDNITGIILSADRGVRLAICGVGLFILMLYQWLGVSRREFPFGIVAGFVVFSAVHMLVAIAMAHPTVLHRLTLSAISSSGYLLAALIWLGYAILSPNVVRTSSAGSTPPRGCWPGGPGYALRATKPWWSKLRLRGFSTG